MPRRLTRQRANRAGNHADLLPWLALVLLAWLAGCASAPERPETLRQALLGLGQQAANRVAEAPALTGETLADQVLLLSSPKVDERLDLSVGRVQESLTRGLLAIDDGPQVLDWQPGDTPAADTNQWLVDSRLIADGPRLRLSDRELVPYRLELRVRRPGDGAALWSTVISGAFDADAL